jgi:transposase
MTGYRFSYPPQTSSMMLSIMKEASDSITYKRAQCVYLRSKYNYCPQQIAQMTGLSSDRIRHVHSLYRKYGKKIIYCGKRGGRNNANMKLKEEVEFLEQYEPESLSGKIITASLIHQDLENFLSKSLHQSGIYKMLQRNGWRKILPRPQHPDHNQEAIEAFKKTSLHWSKEQI